VINVKLTRNELLWAANVGIRRHAENLELGRRDRYGAGVDGWEMHIAGAVAELAFSKGKGLYWSGAHVFKASDLKDWEIRSTHHAEGRLILHPDDHGRFALVRRKTWFEFDLVGWVEADQVKLPKWWEDPQRGRAAFFIPNSELREL
jgi:hypothetical protein